jgi:hypothetical protein
MQGHCTSQPGNEHAGRAIGIAPETLLRWMKEPEFDVAYREAKRKAFCQSIARLQQSNGRRCHDLTEGHSAAAVRDT